MSIDATSFETRPFTVQHDRILQAIARQMRDLEARLGRLEIVIDNEVSASHFGDDDRIHDVRASSKALATQINELDAELSSPASAPAPQTPKPATTSDVTQRPNPPRQQRPAAHRRAHAPGWQPSTLR